MQPMKNDKMIMALVLGFIAVLTAVDVVFDLLAGGSAEHVAIEIFIFLVSIAGLALIGREFVQAKENLMQELEQSRQDLKIWKQDAQNYIRGLGEAIDRQMTRWEFTPAEKEIGLLLLKGFSFKEIASIRGASERTTRQQSLSIYRKSGMSGRAEFSAFFLEDLLLPEQEKEED